MALIDTDPKLVEAGFEALKPVVPDANGFEETTFTYQEKEYWIKVRRDPHAGGVDSAWLLPVGDSRIGRV